jgi:hypothetical protein
LIEMQIADLNNPGDRKKLIWAALLGLVAILVLWWTFIGFGSSAKPVAQKTAVAPSTPGARSTARNATTQTPSDLNDLAESLKPVSLPQSNPSVSEAKRNIFAYYEAPQPSAQAQKPTPTPTPTPTPPVLLAAISPQNVYARMADFTLEVSGDKFSPELRIYVDGRDLGTKYRSPQQLSSTVPAAMIATPGARQIVVRSADGRLYSNPLTLSVAPPPIPNYSYVGIIGFRSHVDTAILQDKSNKEVLNVQRGDVLGGRFRVTSISDKELVLVDTNLKIRHNLAMIEGEKGSGPLSRPTPAVVDVDDEP